MSSIGASPASIVSPALAHRLLRLADIPFLGNGSQLVFTRHRLQTLLLQRRRRALHISSGCDSPANHLFAPWSHTLTLHQLRLLVIFRRRLLSCSGCSAARNSRFVGFSIRGGRIGPSRRIRSLKGLHVLLLQTLKYPRELSNSGGDLTCVPAQLGHGRTKLFKQGERHGCIGHVVGWVDFPA